MRTRCVVAPVCAALLGFAAPALAGDLTPPPGPIQPTNRVQLNQQTHTPPILITAPGSYVLTSNITGVAGAPGIIVNANNVTIDLNGFALLGAAGSLDGVFVNTGRTNTTILNGAISGWGQRGVDAYSGARTRASGLTVTNNLESGLLLGRGSIVTDCTLEANGGSSWTGLVVGAGSLVQRCVVTASGGHGVGAESGSSVIATTARNNAGAGILTFDNTTVRDCVVEGNGYTGAYTGDASLVVATTANANRVAGLSVGDDSQVIDCVISRNILPAMRAGDEPAAMHVFGLGPAPADAQTIVRPRKSVTASLPAAGAGEGAARSVTTREGADGAGIYTGNRATVRGCTINANQYTGLFAGDSCRIDANLVSGNAESGIVAFDGSVIIDNAISLNAIAGVLVDASDIVIEANRLRGNGITGIALLDNAAFCLVGRNTLLIDDILNYGGQSNRVAPIANFVDETLGPWINIAF